jgi:hypothetical protein
MLVILLIIHVELVGSDSFFSLTLFALFAWLISHQPAVLFSQNKPAPAISHQPTEQATCLQPLSFVSLFFRVYTFFISLFLHSLLFILSNFFHLSLFSLFSAR